MRTLRAVLLTIVVIPAAAPSWAGHTLTAGQTAVTKRWLAKNPGQRLATAADCNCAGDIEAIRAGLGGPWKPVPDYQPYVASGDFNGDGRRDFAVVVRTERDAPVVWTLLVFNAGDDEPAYADRTLDFGRLALFFGAPRPKPYRLVVGAFESEGATLEPHGRTYTLMWDEH